MSADLPRLSESLPVHLPGLSVHRRVLQPTLSLGLVFADINGSPRGGDGVLRRFDRELRAFIGLSEEEEEG